MAIEALQRILQIIEVKKKKDAGFPPHGQKKSKPDKETKKENTGKIDIKI
jgi:hypothetical protein